MGRIRSFSSEKKQSFGAAFLLSKTYGNRGIIERLILSPEGALLAALCFVMLMRSKGKQRANFPRRGKYREAGIGVHFHGRSPVGMFSPRAKGAAFRFYHKRRPPIFQGAYHRCEAAYKICGEATTTTLPLLVLRTTFPPAHRSGDKRKAPLFSRVPLRGTPRSGKGCTEVRMMMLL